MNEREKSTGFFASAFAVLVLLPVALFVVFLLAAGYRFGLVSTGQIPVFFAAAMLAVLAAFLVLRHQVRKAFFQSTKK
ncbi:MAG: hypothetical protein HY392_02160 [Candidatus Diapherotrites archaeon]|nr:hypothetical protein [Candidatus Diapherotrites archaeon]